MRELLKPVLLIALALLVPVLPLFLLGLSFEDRVESWFERDLSAEVRFALIVGVLAVDVFLPVPSSAVSTYGGGILGTLPATAASWLGMTAGAVFAFGLARLFGKSFADRFSSSADLKKMALLSERFGPLALVLTRALPILAEACVLLMGATRLSWRRFWPAVLVSNLAISVTYAAFGEYSQGRDALPAAVAASLLIPLGLTVMVRRWLPSWSVESGFPKE